MRALVWITPDGWEACVDHAREHLPADADVTLLTVIDDETVRLAVAAAPGRLGRHRAAPEAGAVGVAADGEARALLDAAAQRLARPAQPLVRRGRVEHEVARACEDADLLVIARDGEPRRGPRSLGRRGRLVVDHAACDVALVWATPRGAREDRPLPPPPRG